VAEPTGAQASHMLTSMLGADGLAIILHGEGEMAAGERVDVELL
jgi:molybdopterin biosynthesis enzyme